MAVFEGYVPAPQARETPVPMETRKESGATETLLGYGLAKYLRAQLLITEANPGKYEAVEPMPPIKVSNTEVIDVKLTEVSADIEPLPIEEPPSPALHVFVEDSVDEGANWNAIGAFVPTTTTGRQALNVTEPFSDYIRIRWEIPEGTSYTFAVDWVAEINI